MRCTTVCLKKKEIINLCDGSRLGCATDFEFDCDCATILSLMVPGPPCGFLGLGKREYLIIPWNKIECIGEDTVLVRLNPNECRSLPEAHCCDCCGGKGRDKRGKM